ncbi:phosphonate C-P lyase system protein PhnG [Aquabacter spiritensis]|uniref:Alpha-D-ribose 1-methylphosphonate 5-triphosphate synthase subunit PhnG n=1 Tax=Aquabacter spiritensis TaxID=933073 RepID=A0A4R3LPY1_9HYPH|nr:phosphonate C-P lyase system protein PhnG [Aquabacter spiritensis]TCT02584.1 alpha-D-ribose 1-methylphosphonate 5-triphosphate synthase subunit PhnG [Aquabacter spiritensis]
MTSAEDPVQRRKALMQVLARADQAELEAAIDRFTPLPPLREPRPAETGLVMVRGRIGGDGAPFNLGEATVTRAAVQLNDVTGVSYLLGRAPERARAAAILDALWQDPAAQPVVEEALAPVRRRLAEAAAEAAAKVEATRVNFFTMARGED